MIIIKTEEQIQHIRVAGSIIKHCFSVLRDFLSQNIDGTTSTYTVDKFIHETILKEGGEAAFLGYQGFPAASCISLNHEIIHGIPSKHKFIHKNDIISIDIGVKFQKYYADSAFTFYFGKDKRILDFLEVTQLSLHKGIQSISAHTSVLDISKAIENFANQASLGIVKEYCGHGVGIELHEAPEIPNYTHQKYYKKLKKNMIIAIEPMFTFGSGEVRLADDGFTVLSKDNTLASHFEHTVLVGSNAAEILT